MVICLPMSLISIDVFAIGPKGCEYLKEFNICVIESDYPELDLFIENKYHKRIMKTLPFIKDLSLLIIKLL